MIPDPQKVKLAMLLRSIGYNPSAGGGVQRKEMNQPPVRRDYGADGVKQLFTFNVKDTTKDIKELSKILGLEGTYKSAGNVYQNHDDYSPDQEAQFSKDFDEKTKGVSMKVLDLGKGLRQRSFVDASGKEIYRGQVYKEQSTSDMFKEGLSVMAPIALSFVPGLGTAIGSKLGLSGKLATIAGSGLLNTGMSIATGADPKQAIKAGLIGSAGAGINAFGASQGWNPAVTRIAAGTVPAALAGRDPLQALLSAAIGQVNPTGMKGIDSLLQTVAKQKLSQGRKP